LPLLVSMCRRITGHLLPNNGEEEPKLYDVAIEFFKKMNFHVREDVTLIGTSGKRHHFNLEVKLDSEVEIKKILVLVVNWNRAVGVDRLIRFERMLNDLDKRKGMIISNSFSGSAVKFAKRAGLILYTREHLRISSG